MQRLRALRCDSGVIGRKLSQAAAFPKENNAGVCNLGPADIEVDELFELADQYHSLVTDLRSPQSKVLHAAHFFEMDKTGISNPRAAQAKISQKDHFL